MENKKIRYILIILIFLFFALLFKVFSVKNAENIVYQYYNCIQKEDWDGAYKHLSKDTKEDISFNRFQELYNIKREFIKIESFNISKGYKDDGIVIIPVDIKMQYLYDVDKLLENSFKSRLVLEGMNYRLILNPNEFYGQLSQTYIDYIWEKFIWRDDISVNEAAEAINKALEYDEDNPDIYYTYANIATNEEDALYLLDKSIELAKKRDYWHLSYAYNMKGEILEKQGNLEDAKTNYLLATKEDSTNEIAIKNLEKVNDLLGENNNENDISNIEIETKDTDKWTSLTKTNKKHLTYYDKIYLEKMLSIIEDFSTNLKSIDNLMSDPDPESTAWVGKLVASISLVELSCDDVDNTISPDKFKRMHKEVYFASKSYRLAMENLIDVVDNLSTSSAEKYKSNIEEANKRIEKATEELNKIKKEYGF